MGSRTLRTSVSLRYRWFGPHGKEVTGAVRSGDDRGTVTDGVVRRSVSQSDVESFGQGDTNSS